MEVNSGEIRSDCETGPEANNDNQTVSVVEKEKQIEPVLEREQTELSAKENQREPLAKDPFAYLDRNDFTSEKYKLEVRNLPKYYGIAVSVTEVLIFLFGTSTKIYMIN